MGTLELSRFADSLLDLVFPPGLYCRCCGKIIDDTRTYRLCDDCMDSVKWISGRTCVKCGKHLSESNPGDECFSCRSYEHRFDRGYTCTEYGTCERAMVFALKYDGKTYLAETIGEIMADRMLAEFGSDELCDMYDLVLPVPVHRSKKLIRGFNHAALIASAFARRTGLKSSDKILERARVTHVMKSLKPDERRENIRGSFRVVPGRESLIQEKRVLLVDDIYTTGATVDEIARILNEPWKDPSGALHPGAARADVLTFAAGADVIKSS